MASGRVVPVSEGEIRELVNNCIYSTYPRTPIYPLNSLEILQVADYFPLDIHPYMRICLAIVSLYNLGVIRNVSSSCYFTYAGVWVVPKQPLEPFSLHFLYVGEGFILEPLSVMYSTSTNPNLQYEQGMWKFLTGKNSSLIQLAFPPFNSQCMSLLRGAEGPPRVIQYGYDHIMTPIQEQVVKQAINLKVSLILNLPTGFGKTMIACSILEKEFCVLVCCYDKAGVDNWYRQLMGMNFIKEHQIIRLYKGLCSLNSCRNQKWSILCEYHRYINFLQTNIKVPFIVISTYCYMFSKKYHNSHFKKPLIRACIVDEAHKFPPYVYDNMAKNLLSILYPCEQGMVLELQSCGYEMQGLEKNKGNKTLTPSLRSFCKELLPTRPTLIPNCSHLMDLFLQSVKDDNVEWNPLGHSPSTNMQYLKQSDVGISYMLVPGNVRISFQLKSCDMNTALKMLPGIKGSILTRTLFLSATIDQVPFQKAFGQTVGIIKLPPGFKLNVVMKLIDDRWTASRWVEQECWGYQQLTELLVRVIQLTGANNCNLMVSVNNKKFIPPLLKELNVLLPHHQILNECSLLNNTASYCQGQRGLLCLVSYEGGFCSEGMDLSMFKHIVKIGLPLPNPNSQIQKHFTSLQFKRNTPSALRNRRPLYDEDYSMDEGEGLDSEGEEGERTGQQHNDYALIDFNYAANKLIQLGGRMNRTSWDIDDKSIRGTLWVVSDQLPRLPRSHEFFNLVGQFTLEL